MVSFAHVPSVSLLFPRSRLFVTGFGFFLARTVENFVFLRKLVRNCIKRTHFSRKVRARNGAPDDSVRSPPTPSIMTNQWTGRDEMERGICLEATGGILMGFLGPSNRRETSSLGRVTSAMRTDSYP